MLGLFYYLLDLKGHLKFTERGLKELRPYFAMAGIDIKYIKTEAEYRRARAAASPLLQGLVGTANRRVARYL